MATGAIDLDGDGQPNFITRGTTDLFVARYTPTGALSWAHNAGGDWSLAFIDLHDVLGRHVDSLHQGFLPAGEHRFIIDGNALPAGVYAVRLRGEALTAIRLIVRVP